MACLRHPEFGCRGCSRSRARTGASGGFGSSGTRLQTRVASPYFPQVRFRAILIGTMCSRRTLLAAGCALFLLLFHNAAYAQEWEYLGQSRVDGSRDHDNIEVGRAE